jgi:Spy/CpxP family protein refolding chaperone
MKLNRNVGLLVLAIASIGGAAGIVSAQTSSSSSSSSTATTTAHTGHKWHHHGGFMLGMTLRATKQLNLTADQQASIKSILSTARAQAKAAHAANGSTVDMTVLANPGDPNYATALQNAKSLASTRIQNESEIQGQIYNVLTADQKAQLPTVLAAMKAKAAARRAAWQAQHSSSSSAG